MSDFINFLHHLLDIRVVIKNDKNIRHRYKLENAILHLR